MHKDDIQGIQKIYGGDTNIGGLLTDISSLSFNSSKTIHYSALCNSSVVVTNWTASSNVIIISKNNSQITIRGKACTSDNTSRLGWVQARLSNGKVLTETFKYEALPVIKFADTSLTQALLNPNANTTVNYSAVTVRDGDRIRFTVEGASSVQWKNTRPLSPSTPNPGSRYGGRYYYVGYVPPYSGCYGSSGSPPNSLPSAQASRLLNYYFIQSGDWQAPGYSPPIQLLSGSGDVLEVELTARNACGCTTAVNHYKVSRAASRTSPSAHSLTVSPNPVRTSINIQVKAPPFQSPVRRDNLASLEACCRKFNSDKRYGRYYSPQPECCRQLNSYRSSNLSNRYHSYQLFSYALSVFHTSTNEKRYTKTFLLSGGQSKIIPLNVRAWPRGLYVVNVITNEGHQITRKVMIQ